jgi:hypothetical protein
MTAGEDTDDGMKIGFHELFVQVDLVEVMGRIGVGVEDDVEIVEAGDLPKR